MSSRIKWKNYTCTYALIALSGAAASYSACFAGILDIAIAVSKASLDLSRQRMFILYLLAASQHLVIMEAFNAAAQSFSDLLGAFSDVPNQPLAEVLVQPELPAADRQPAASLPAAGDRWDSAPEDRGRTDHAAGSGGASSSSGPPDANSPWQSWQWRDWSWHSWDADGADGWWDDAQTAAEPLSTNANISDSAAVAPRVQQFAEPMPKRAAHPWHSPEARQMPPPPVQPSMPAPLHPPPPPPPDRQARDDQEQRPPRTPRPRGGKKREWHAVFHSVKKLGQSDEVARRAANAAHPQS